MIDLGKLLHLQGPLLWLPCTLVLYAGSSTLYRRLNKAPIANPTLLTIAALILIFACSGVPYKAYFDSVAILNYLLGTAVVAPALPLYRSIDRLKVRLHGAGIGRRFAGQHLVGLSVARRRWGRARYVAIQTIRNRLASDIETIRRAPILLLSTQAKGDIHEH